MRQRLLIVSELYYPEETSTGYFVTGIAEGLAEELGVDVSVLCAQPTYSQRGISAPAREIKSGVAIERIGAPTGDKNKLLGRAWIFFSLTCRFAWRLVRGVRRGDMVLVLTNPPSLPLLAALIAASKGAGVVLLMHDVYPDVLVATGLTHKQSFIYRIVDWLQKNILRRMLHVVVLGRDMRERIRSKFDSSETCPALSVIPNWGDVTAVHPDLRINNNIRQQHSLGGKFILQFSGNLGRTHGLDDLVELAKRLKSTEEIHILIFGWGAGREWLKEAIAKDDLHNITLLPPCSKDELGVYLTACDLFMLPFKKGMEGISVPSRLYNVMAAGNPVLAVADSRSELATVVNEESIGWVVEPGDVESMLIAVHSAMADRTLLSEMGQRARRAAEGKYTRNVVVQAFVGMLQNCGNR